MPQLQITLVDRNYNASLLNSQQVSLLTRERFQFLSNLSNTFSYSLDDWKSAQLYQIVPLVSYQQVLSLHASPYDLILQTTGGVYRATADAPQWILIKITSSSAVVTTLDQPFALNRLDCNRTIISDAVSKILCQTTLDSQCVDLLSTEGKDMWSSMNLRTVDIISIAIGSHQCTYTRVLVQSAINGYQLLQFDGSEWSLQFQFPTSIRSSPSPFPLVDNNYAGVALTSNNLSFGNNFSNDMFTYGNCVLFSDNGGDFWLVLRCFNNGSLIVSFDSSRDGSFAFVTDDGQAYYGHRSWASLIPLFTPANSIGCYFDIDGAVFFNTINGIVAADLSFAVQAAILSSNLTCPFTQIQMKATHDVYFTRQSIVTQTPQTIYMDQSDVFAFNLTLSHGEKIGLIDAPIQFDLSSNKYLSLNHSVFVDHVQAHTTYTVIVTDRGQRRNQSLPGQDLAPTAVRVNLPNSALACSGTILPSVCNDSKKTLILRETSVHPCKYIQAADQIMLFDSLQIQTC